MPALPEPKCCLTPSALAEELGFIGPRTLKRWRLEGKGPPYIRLSRQRVVYPAEGVARWLGERTFRHRAEELAQAVDVAPAHPDATAATYRERIASNEPSNRRGPTRRGQARAAVRHSAEVEGRT